MPYFQQLNKQSTIMRIALYVLAIAIAITSCSFYLDSKNQENHLQKEQFIVSTFSSDAQTLQKTFEGVFAENGLWGPYTVKYCFDDATAHKIVQFLGEVLAKAAKGSVTDLIQIVKLVKQFGTTIPEYTLDCLGRSQQIRSLGYKYNIDGGTDFTMLQIHIAGYITLHYLEVHRWAVDLNDKWTSKRYYETGFSGAQYGHKLLY